MNESIDVVFVHPGAARVIYQSLADDLTAIEPPTWVRMNAGWLRDRGYRVAIIDQDAERLTPEAVAQEVEAIDPRLVVTVAAGQQPSASTQSMVGVKAVTSVIFDVNPERPQAVLGHHVSALPERTADELNVYWVVDGEGPHGLQRILESERLELDGIVRDDRLAHPDDLHGDVWDLLPSLDHYRAHPWQCLDGSPRSPYASLYTTLGCPFKCSFCMINVIQHGNAYRRRTPEAVVDQVRVLYEQHNVRTFKFADEMFVLDPRHYVPICDGLAALPFVDELNIWAYARVDTVKPETLARLRRAGIRWLALGIESGSAHVRDGADKPLTGSAIAGTVRAIQRAGINVIGNFIFGLPDDTWESMRATLSLATQLRCEWANFYSAMAYPGSRLYEHALRNRREDLPAAWSGYSQHSYDCTPLPTATLSSRDVLDFRDQAHHAYFTDPDYHEMLNKRFGYRAVELAQRVAEPLKRRLLGDVL